MTKRQMADECLRLAPDFSLRFHRAGDIDSLVVSFTDDPQLPPVAITMPLGGHGRASVETQLIRAAPGRLRGRGKTTKAA